MKGREGQGMRGRKFVLCPRKKQEKSAPTPYTADLVGGESHELFGGSFPDGGNRDDPANVVADDARRRLVAELLEGVVTEEPQRVREHRQRRVPAAVRGSDRRLLVQVLHIQRQQQSRPTTLPTTIVDI